MSAPTFQTGCEAREADQAGRGFSLTSAKEGRSRSSQNRPRRREEVDLRMTGVLGRLDNEVADIIVLAFLVYIALAVTTQLL